MICGSYKNGRMMKFLHNFSDSITKRGVFGSSIVRVSAYSSEAPPSLFEKLQKCSQQRVSVIPVLDEWVAQVGSMRRRFLELVVRGFRARRRFTPALQIVEWMSRNRMSYAITPKLAAIHLELVFKVHGIEQAEKYFNGLKKQLLGLPVHVALLNCYAKVKNLTQAEVTMNSIRKFDSCTTLPYNIMLGLYSVKREDEKLNALIQEMQYKGIAHDNVTYMILFKTYAQSDLDRMEKLLVKMESDDGFSVDFHTYATAAKGYFKAGAVDKAYELFKKADSVIGGVDEKSTTFLSSNLITYYASMHKREDVYRIWNKLPKIFKLPNYAFFSMIRALTMLDDLDGARKILEEWEGTNTSFDIEIPNIVILAYCKKGDVVRAEIILKRLVDSGRELSSQTFSYMALGYLKNGMMEKAVEMKRKASLTRSPNCKSIPVDYLQNKGDADVKQEMLMLLEKYGSSSKEMRGKFSSNGSPITEYDDESGEDLYIPFFTSTVAHD